MMGRVALAAGGAAMAGLAALGALAHGPAEATAAVPDVAAVFALFDSAATAGPAPVEPWRTRARDADLVAGLPHAVEGVEDWGDTFRVLGAVANPLQAARDFSPRSAGVAAPSNASNLSERLGSIGLAAGTGPR